MNKILIALLLTVAATSAMACKCPAPKKTEPEICKTHEEFNIEEAQAKEQARQDRLRQRRQQIKDRLSELVNIP